jgi:hypothetical protein
MTQISPRQTRRFGLRFDYGVVLNRNLNGSHSVDYARPRELTLECGRGVLFSGWVTEFFSASAVVDGVRKDCQFALWGRR